MTESRETELFEAIKAGELGRVKELITANPALVNARTEKNESAILTAVYHRRKEIANLQEKPPPGCSNVSSRW